MADDRQGPEERNRPRTAAQRQAALRARRRAGHAFRLQVWLPEDAGNALRRLAAHHGTGQAAVVARLLMAADAEAAAGVPDDRLDAYYGVEREAPAAGPDIAGQVPASGGGR